MAKIIFVHELPRGSSGREKSKRTAKRVFHVCFDARDSSNAVDAETATDPETGLAIPSADSKETLDLGITISGDPLPGDSSRRVKSINVGQDGDTGRYFFVSVDYETVALGTTSVNEDPLDRPPDVKWSFQTSTEPTYLDRDENIIINSALETFDPPVERTINDPVLTITRNEKAFITSTAIQYIDTINSDAFMGAAPGQARITSISAQKKIEGETEYYEVSYEITFRRDGWTTMVRDEGYMKFDGTKVVVITDDDGKPRNSPTLLDGNGLVLKPGADAVFLPFDLYPQQAFSPLDLTKGV